LNKFDIDLEVSPSPTAYLLANTNMNLACAPLAGLLNTVSLVLTPFVPELRGDFTYTQQAQTMKFNVALPQQKIGSQSITTNLQDNSLAFLVVGNP
jgi:hypothetical protein